MNENVLFFNMFAQYQPPEPLLSALSQAAVVAADIDPETRKIDMVIYASRYIPKRLLDLAGEDICRIYGLRHLEIKATHPSDQLSCVEPEELMALFVDANSMTRGSLAGAQWRWQDNGKLTNLSLYSISSLLSISRAREG